MYASHNDRVRIDFSANVSEDARIAIVDAIAGAVASHGLYSYCHENRATDNAWSA